MSDLTSRLVLVAALSLGGLSLAACSGDEIERDFGLSRTAPDEFTVTTRAPLSMPTSADLNKPVPGAERPQEQSSQTQALETLAPDVALRGAGGSTSAGQQALVEFLGTLVMEGVKAYVAGIPVVAPAPLGGN